MPHQLVCAAVSQDCILNTLKDVNGNVVNLNLPAGKDICYLVLEDNQMGGLKAGGRTGQVWVQGYFITTNSMQENTFTAWMLEKTTVWATVGLPDNRLDANAIFTWLFRAKPTLYQRDLDPDLRWGSQPLKQKDIFKGTQKQGRHMFNKSKGKDESPEAFLAMALKKGLPQGTEIKSGVKERWTVYDLYAYAGKIAKGG